MIKSASPASERPFHRPSLPRGGQKLIQDAVADGVEGWRTRQSQSPDERLSPTAVAPVSLDGQLPDLNGRAGQPGVMAHLPRRSFLPVKAGDTTPPKMRFISFQTSYTGAFKRLFVWFSVLTSFVAGALWDQLKRQDTLERRAVRLRQIFERTGGTFIKIGQHLAMRIDFMPWVYCVELSKMLDKMPPFPVTEAIAQVERSTGKPLDQIFSQFDPEPIGATSVACVYQALLKNGEKVVVKVRRPGVGEMFLADCLALDWLAMMVEFMTFWRPGHTRPMRREFRETLLEELDFIQEARYQDSFRRAAKKSGRKFFTSPRVYFELCSEDIIVEEFVNGMWLWELLAAVERNDEDVLSLARQLNIDPQKVAQRLTWVNFWGWHEHLFFHADPHPDNIIVRPNSQLTFIDFGSIGAVDRTKRQALQQNMYYARKEDPLNMARASLILLEPLPPIDLIDFTKELESHNWQMLYAFAGQKSNKMGSDRTSAIQWIGLIDVARKYGVTIDFHILRLLWATLFYDTLSTRLDKDLHIIDEYRQFSKTIARQIGRRTRRTVARQLTNGFDDSAYIRIERWVNAGEGLFFRLRHLLTIPSVNFSMLMSKWSFAIFTLVTFVTQILVMTGLAMTAISGWQYVTIGEVASSRALFQQTINHWGYQLLILFLLFINSRSLLFRLDDKEV